MKFFTKVIATLGLGALFWYDQNNRLQTTRYSIKNKRIPNSFKGYKIIQLSDLHGKELGYDSQNLVKAIKKENPDIIVITGDIIDGRKGNDNTIKEINSMISLSKQLVKIAPTYFVAGNHEMHYGRIEERIKEKITFLPKLKSTGVIILDRDCLWLEKDKDKIALIGLNDIYLDSPSLLLNLTNEATQYKDFKILLAHEPQYIKSYNRANIDLALTGHTHGGQIRLPFIGGLYAPQQGILPQYDGGKFQYRKTTLIVNRGIGNSIFPLRVFNHPEMVVVTLE